ncbi:MAG: hypothetical protein ACRD2J_16195 [Thermoanaerobaculia bacterium]
MSETTESAPLDPKLLRDLRGTRRWVRILARITIVIAALLVAVALIGLAFGAFRGDLAPRESGILLLVTVLVAALWALPGLQLNRFARTLQRAETGAATLADVFREQHSTWRLLGIVALLVVAAYVILPLLAMLSFWFPR